MFIEMRSLALRRWLLAAIAAVCIGACDSSAPRQVPEAASGELATGAPAVHSASSIRGGDFPTAERADHAPTADAPLESLAKIATGSRLPPPPQLAVDEALRDNSAEAKLSDAETEPPDPRDSSNADLSLRNRDFPRTYIESIHVDLTSPHHWVRLTWAGPKADRQEPGPFRSSPGSGLGHNNCDDVAESQHNGSNCTPKGENVVEGFSDYLPSVPRCEFVTWFNLARQIAFHSHWQVPHRPASHGCVRLNKHAAQLIHNNARIGKTRVLVDGTWSRW